MKLSDSMELANFQSEVIDPQIVNIRNLIAVTEPYYALSNLSLDEDVLSATIPLQMVNHMEPYGMAIPEIGRHMAILGSLALANANPKKEKHYYLATHAIVERKHNKPVGDGTYFGKVRVESFTKRVGKINGELFDPTGELFCTIEVEYAVLHEVIFNRMFANEKRVTNFSKTHNPYSKSSQLYNVKLNKETSSASLGRIKPEDCAGHFNDYAALPIARLGGALTSLSGLHYNILRNTNEKYCIRKAEIHAKSFVFAGNTLNLFTKKIQETNSNETCIESFANTEECNCVLDYKLWFY